MTKAIVKVQGGPVSLPTLLGPVSARIPTGGKIRPGIMVLTKRAADSQQAKDIYRQGVAKGQSFDQIQRSLLECLPQLKSPLVPRNVPWFTVRAKDFPNPEVALQILETYGEDRGEGRQLYSFPVVFPSDHWQTVMPHELAAWGAHEKRFWSEYSADGLTRHCMTRSPVPMDDSGQRAIRIFGGRKSQPRESNGGICNPETCPEYQQRQCNLAGSFRFFIPGIRTITAIELPTTSFYSMSNALQRFQAIGHMRGGRISGFLGRAGETFVFTKVLREVPHIDEEGRAVRVSQWLIELEAPVDVTAFLRSGEDVEVAIGQADHAAKALEGRDSSSRSCTSPPADSQEQGAVDMAEVGIAGRPECVGNPTIDQIVHRAKALRLKADDFVRYNDQRWGKGWRVNQHARSRAWHELERYCNDPQGFGEEMARALHQVEGRD